jgi:prepilin-type N-terminal cleavage/methylation domain-containing protein
LGDDLKRTKLSGIPRCGRGFTLFEILVVVAIIGILSAIFLGNMSSLRGKAEQVEALSNLRQVFHATQLYAGDNNGQIIPSRYQNPGFYKDWRQLLVDLGYVQAPVNLARNSAIFGNPARFKLHPGSGFSTFAMNERVGYRPASIQYGGIGKFIEAESLSKTIFLADGNYAPGAVTLTDYPEAIWPPSSVGPAVATGLNPTFKDQVCLLFMDGHAEAWKLGDIPKDFYSTLESQLFWLGKRL